MGQYYLACGLAIILQYLFTIVVSRYTHYILANIMGIVVAAILAYLLNDIWTFAVRKKGGK
jgi:putative flippase GtrA